MAIRANGVAFTSNSEIPYEVEMGEMKKVCNAKNGLKPIIEKIIEPGIKVKKTAIIGTKIFINCEEFDLVTIVGKKLFIFTTHK